MTKRYWAMLLIGISTTLIILGWYVVDSSKIGIIDYIFNKKHYSIIREEISKEKSLQFAYGEIYVGDKTVCKISDMNCPEKYSRFVDAVILSNVSHASYVKSIQGIEIATRNSRDTPFWSDWSERFYLYDPNGTITRRVLQDYGDGWKLSYNYVFDIEQR